MHTEPDIPIVADGWLAGVQTHADTDRRTVRPLVLRERVLGRNRPRVVERPVLRPLGGCRWVCVRTPAKARL